MKILRTSTLVLALVTALVLLAGLPVSHAGAPSSEGASVTISNIADGDVLPTEFTVKFAIAGMGIAPAGVEIDNTGHHHLLIDIVELPPMDQPLPPSDQLIHFGKGQTETTLNLPEGQHTLQLIFADHSHTPHDPPVMSERITIAVSADAPPQAEEESESE